MTSMKITRGSTKDTIKRETPIGEDSTVSIICKYNCTGDYCKHKGYMSECYKVEDQDGFVCELAELNIPVDISSDYLVLPTGESFTQEELDSVPDRSIIKDKSGGVAFVCRDQEGNYLNAEEEFGESGWDLESSSTVPTRGNFFYDVSIFENEHCEELDNKNKNK